MLLCGKGIAFTFLTGGILTVAPLTPPSRQQLQVCGYGVFYLREAHELVGAVGAGALARTQFEGGEAHECLV